MSYKVSVIVPFYNVEPYFNRCLESLFAQTLPDIEFIFINDSSTDDSRNILVKAIEASSRCKDVRIIDFEENKGIAEARTKGFKEATGEYVIQCDADDYIENVMLETMYVEAIKNDSDIVMCDFFIECADQIFCFKNPVYNNPRKYIENFYQKFHDFGFLWNKLVRKSLIDKYEIYPYKGFNHAEDLNCTMRMFHYADSITCIEEPLYHYNKHSGSLSDNLKKQRALYQGHFGSIKKICEFLESTRRKEYNRCIAFLKFTVKMNFIKELNLNKKEWFYLYKECTPYIRYFKDNSLKSRIVLRIAFSNYILFKLFNKRLRIYPG